jgi:hypothetical protein
LSNKKLRFKKNTMVDITKLRIGYNPLENKVLMGVADEEGVIDDKQPAIDITEDFFYMAQEIVKMQVAAAEIRKKDAEASKSKIIMPNEFEKRTLGTKG